MVGPGILGLSVVRHAAQSRSQADVFDNLFLVFLVLGTVVGVVVISYVLYSAYKYRVSGDSEKEGKYDVDEDALEGESGEKDKVSRPQLGEIPSQSGKGGGRKLFMSFAVSAVLVLGLIIYAYSLLLYVEGAPNDFEDDEDEDVLEIKVTGQQFQWEFEYPNGESYTGGQGDNPMVVPADRPVRLTVTSADVHHNLGIPEYRAKTDAIPGETTETWFIPEEGDISLKGDEMLDIVCYELCGAGHSSMRGKLNVTDQETFENWYENELPEASE
jgi:cytochrome c oxidase subunit 2